MKVPSLFAPHPTDVSLKRYADGELHEPERDRMTKHLSRCPDCRSAIAFMRELRAASVSLPAIQPPNGLYERVTAERAARERFNLPADAPLTRRSVSVASVGGPLLFVALAAASAVVYLHAPGRLTLPGMRPVSRPMHALSNTGRSRTTSRGVVDIAAATYDGRQAWRLAQSWTDSTVELDTIFVERDNLRPIGRVSRVRPYLRYAEIVVRQQFAEDSVLGWMHTDRTFGRPVRRRLPPESGPYLPSEALAPFFLETVDLVAGWRGTLSIVGWAVVQNDVYFLVALRVVGEERITVPGGAFDCWRIAIASGNASVDFWVRKSDGLCVRTRKRSRSLPGGVEEVVYVRD